MTQASASHHIRSLEKWLGAPLFERLPRSVQLTEMGKGYLPAVRRALDDLTSATIDLFGVAARKSITIQAPTAFMSLWMAPRLHRFAAAHPGIELRLQTTNWPSGNPDDEVDIEIRYGEGNWPGFASVALVEEPAILVCAPGLLPARPAQSLVDLPDPYPWHRRPLDCSGTGGPSLAQTAALAESRFICRRTGACDEWPRYCLGSTLLCGPLSARQTASPTAAIGSRDRPGALPGQSDGAAGRTGRS